MPELVIAEKTRIELSSDLTSELHKYQISARVLPAEAAQDLVYIFVEQEAADYFTITPEGLVTAIPDLTQTSGGGRAKLTTPLGEETPVYYHVRVSAKDDTSKFVEIAFATMSGLVQRVSFDRQFVEMNIGDAPITVSPVFTPYFSSPNAESDGAVHFLSSNPDVATVNGTTGVVTPLSKGTSSIIVTVNSATTVSGKTLTARIDIRVTYPYLNYSIRVRNNDTSFLKMSADKLITFDVDLWRENDDLSDPDPEIVWTENGYPINGIPTANQKSLHIVPSQISMVNPGSHKIVATLISGDKQQVLELPTITIYSPITTFNISKRESGADELLIYANTGSGQYPPDGYEWRILDLTAAAQNGYNSTYTDPYLDPAMYDYETSVGIPDEAVLPKLVGGSNIGVLSMSLQSQTLKNLSDYAIVCYPLIHGELARIGTTVIRRVYECVFNDLPNVISGVYVDGDFRVIDDVAEYRPYIKWDSLGYNTYFDVEITVNGEKTLISGGQGKPYSQYFTAYGFIIPSEIATLADDFTVTVRAVQHKNAFPVVYSANDIAPGDYPFLTEIFDGYNRYFANAADFGDYISYITAFRPTPADYYQSGADGEDIYVLDVAFGYTYAESLAEHIGQTVRNNVGTARYAVGDYSGTTALVLPKLLSSPLAEGVEADETKQYMQQTNGERLPELPLAVYASTESVLRSALPVDSLQLKKSVSTSEQLYLALSLGYKPEPVEGSDAEAVYEYFRAALLSICNGVMTEAQKVLAIYDFLATSVTYDTELFIEGDAAGVDYDGFYLEGVVNGKAVCDGIAKAFVVMSRMEGIVSQKINGVAGGGRHAWVRTMLDGVWYLSDPTFASKTITISGESYERLTHKYLLQTEATFNIDHTPYLGTGLGTAFTPDSVFVNLTFGTTTVRHGIYYDNEVTDLHSKYLIPLKAVNPTEAIYFELFISQDYMSTHSYTDIELAALRIKNRLINIGQYSAITFINDGNGYFTYIIETV
jgi:hypothetical protein